MNHCSPLKTLVGLIATTALAAFAQTPVPPVPIAVMVPPPPILKTLSPPTVVGGSATLNPAGNISLQAGRGAITNWDNFKIPPGGAGQFAQPKNSAAVLNRVLSQPVAITGLLDSTRGVALVAPSGVVHLAGMKTSAGSSVNLTGATEANNDITTTPKGEIILPTGATVSLIDSATPGIKVEITGAKSNATNLGAIMAEVGRIGLAGAMARDSSRPNVANIVNVGGRIFLQAGPNGRTSN